MLEPMRIEASLTFFSEAIDSLPPEASKLLLHTENFFFRAKK